MLTIKNAKAYRTFYKEKVRLIQDDSRDEHLISSHVTNTKTGEKTFGWFEIYHGDADGFGNAKSGISNKLLSFLNMAKDGQAVYEFLQNAVDARSTHFTMLWGTDKEDGHDYLLVANNGMMFNTDNVRSILNIGASTKSVDQQSIGKFGIGFKLAHRLVGKENGLDELLTDFSGPVLFSWENNEVAELAKGQTVNPSDEVFGSQANPAQGTNHPWLFKILLTCFPCLPENETVEERPKLFDGIASAHHLFPKTELKALSRWTARLLQTKGSHSYEEGSLFFMRLGEGKMGQLRDHHLEEGVRFSMGILDECTKEREAGATSLQTVQLNTGNAITLPELQYELFRIGSSSEAYAQVYPGEQRANAERLREIEVLFGYCPYAQIRNTFHGAPNFYLYFPLSEEVHQFNFILHCNAFDNSASRTFLQPGTEAAPGVNERLFKAIAQLLEQRMERHLEGQPERFLDLYAAILSSRQSSNSSRKWIYEPFVKPLDALLARMIPVRTSGMEAGFTVRKDAQHIFIKNTHVEVDPEGWGLADMRWFYWDEKDFPLFCERATYKLGIRHFTIFNLLEYKGIHRQINAWLADNPERIDQVLRELSAFPVENPGKEVFNNLLELRILEFSDGTTLSFNDLEQKQDDGYLVLHNTLSGIRDVLETCDFHVTRHDFKKYGFIEKLSNHLKATSQLRGHTELVKLFSQILSEEAAQRLSSDEKSRIYKAFYDLTDQKRTERMPELKLFRNADGQIQYLKNLLKSTDKDWLKPYTVHPEEAHLDLDYLVQKEADLYAGIIAPMWSEIANKVAAHPAEANAILNDIRAFYDKAGDTADLAAQRLWFFQGEARVLEHVFFDPSLHAYAPGDFDWLQRLLADQFSILLPDQWSIPFLEKAPFEREPKQLELKADGLSLPAEDVRLLLQFATDVEVDFYRHVLVESEEGTLRLSEATAARKNCYTSNERLIRYLETYHAETHVLVPEALATADQLPDASNGNLITWLIAQVPAESGNKSRLLELTTALLSESKALQYQWFQQMPSPYLDTSWPDESSAAVYLQLLSNLLEHLDEHRYPELWSKLHIGDAETTIAMGDIPHASDNLVVEHGEKSYELSLSQVLNYADRDRLNIIQQYANECVTRDYLSRSQADKLFKLGEAAEPTLSDFEETLDEMQLGNAHQLAFVMLSEQVNRENLKNFHVQVSTGEWFELYQCYFPYQENENQLIHPNHVLHERYAGLESILKLNDREPFAYGSEDEDLILLHFLFQKGCTSEVLAPEAGLIAKLDYLYSGWKISGRNRVSLADQDWQVVLGFRPQGCVYGTYAIQGETLPEEILTWLKDDPARVKFLADLGVHTDGAQLMNLRKALAKSGAEMPEEGLNGLSDRLLGNSLLGLICGYEEADAKNFPVCIPSDDERLLWIWKVKEQLAESNEPDFPVLVHRPNGQYVLADPNQSSVFFIQLERFEALMKAAPDTMNDLFERCNIIVHWNALNETLANHDALLQTTTFLSEHSNEHTEHFYEAWSNTYRLRLFKAARLAQRITANLEDGDLDLGTIALDKAWYLNDLGDGFMELHYLRDELPLSGLQKRLEEAENTYAAAVQEFNKEQRDLIDRVVKGFQLGDKAIVNLVTEQKKLEDRKRFLDDLDKKVKYSYEWFVAYLGYLDTFSDIEDTTSAKSLFFQRAERHDVDGTPSRNHFYLEDTGQYVTESIEHFSDFELKLRFRDKRTETVQVECVTKKGQNLLVYCRKELSHNFLKALPTVERAEITFIPELDLHKRLQAAFTENGFITPWNEISEALPAIHFIYGPPGTGKTTRLCDHIFRELKAHPEKRFLLLTPTNKAADVLVKKILGERVNQPEVTPNIYRLGSPTDPALEMEDPELYQPSVDIDLVSRAHVLATTIHRMPYFKVETGEGRPRLFQLADHWDYIIFDEASMINLPYMVFALKALQKTHPNAHFLVAGDPKQIPPVQPANDKELEQLGIDEENIYKMLGIDSFDEVEQQAVLKDYPHTIENLDTQYRSVKAIGELFNHFSYNGLLKHHRTGKNEDPKPLPGPYRKLFQTPVSFIPFPLNNEASVYSPKKLLYSSYHLYSALLAAELVVDFDRAAEEEGDRKWSIGLVCPYKAQALLLDKLITARQLSEYTSVQCSTVHGFQGDQCDIILFVVNPNNLKFTGHKDSLLMKRYLYNVAVSRAQNYLWVFHPEYEEGSNCMVDELARINEQFAGSVETLETEALEQHLFKQPRFIELGNHFSGHDQVNVYGISDQEYFVKANHSAIDIQLRKIDRWAVRYMP